FNTDGLRSLLRTCSTPNMVEKTLRYPGHAIRMKVLREAGFFSTEPIQAASGSVVPRDVTEALLFDAWRFDHGDLDLTVLRIIVEGTKDGQRERHTYDMVDHYNPATETTAMARTTGYTCTAMASLVARGVWTQPGLATPEIVGRDRKAYDAVIQHLRERDVYLDMETEKI
ncbi:MAG: saccharopine dehydrogenase C-terminal domain-containing protein, partial [Longimicrobiales bacterium]|nr:saccharopine dehydrogenase C-terminal domain-containing protein [Longimicrobiales bacterium]